jgi:hypothetical protein
MMTKSFGNKEFMQPMRRLKMHSREGSALGLEAVGVGRKWEGFLAVRWCSSVFGGSHEPQLAGYENAF